MKRHSGTLVVLNAYLCVACAGSGGTSSAPSPVPVTEAPIEVTTPSINTATRWKFSPSSETGTYSSLVTTIVTEINNTSSRRDSLTSEAVYSIGTAGLPDSFTFAGAVTSYTSRGPQTGISVTRFPVQFAGKLSSHSLYIQRSDISEPNSNSCGDSSSAPLRMVQRNVLQVPIELANQQTWTDSTTSLICSGAIPLTLTSIRTFHVAGESTFDGSPAIILEQNERTFSKGEGSEGQHRIFIQTQGTRAGRSYINRNSGQVSGANLTGKTTVTIQSSGRSQQFLQTTTEIIQRAR